MKIRLHGMLEEVQEAIARIELSFRVVSISKPYKDRGKSVLYRVYVEVDL
ncbi:hypothetical protein NSQ82_20530 [Caldifermentibacillus hisashii]|nr:hypothetical protein [Caldifermentibacillus hisashii]